MKMKRSEIINVRPPPSLRWKELRASRCAVIHLTSSFFSIFFSRKLQSQLNFNSEEVNQYYLAAELMDDVEANSAQMQAELNENPGKFQPTNIYPPQDNYLTDLTEELNRAISSCAKQHQMLIEFCEMMEDFFSVFVLLKSFQTTFQICNLVYMFLKVSSPTIFRRHSTIRSFVNIYH